MISLSLIFWLMLAVPGFAVLSRFDRQGLESGLLGALGLSYLATFALLSPVSIMCYALHLPLAVFSCACVLLVAAGCIDIIRKGWSRDLREVLIGALGVELLLVVADLALGARIGAYLSGDALLHQAKIRDLLDHGFNNLDPVLQGGYFFSLYHTNILYPLYAVCAQLTGLECFEVWSASLPFGKLLIATGSYCLAWSVFRRQWVAWVAALFLLGAQGPITFIVYPNKLAPLWLLPLIVGFAVEAVGTGARWTTCAKLAAGFLVTGQVHSLYVVFGLLCVGPLLGTCTLIALARRRPGRWLRFACLLAILSGAPFPLVAKVTSHAPEPKANGPEEGGMEAPTDLFHRFADGWVMTKPGHVLGGFEGWRGVWLAAGLTCALIGKRRKEAGVLLVVLATVAVCLYAPPACTALVRLAGAEWPVSRLGIVLRFGFICVVPGSIAFLLEPLLRSRWIRSTVSLAAPIAALPFAYHPKPFDWQHYWKDARKPLTVRTEALQSRVEAAAFLGAHLPRGQTVLVDSETGPRLVSIYDCRIVVAERGHNGVPGMELWRRRKDLKTMLADGTPWHARRGLLKKYDIRYALRKDRAMQWVNSHRKEAWRGRGGELVELDLE